MTDTAPTGPATDLSPRVAIRKIRVDDVYDALNKGWADFRAVPGYGIFFGGVYALVGIVIFLQLYAWDRPFWIVPFALAFPLIGPFVAIGLYEVSRRRETGEPLSWEAVLGVIWQQRNRQLPSMAFVVLAGVLIWMFAAQLILALFLSGTPGGVYSDPATYFNTTNGIAMLIVGSIVGGLIAALLFAITAVSLPLLLDQEIDYVTAMVISFRATVSNQRPMASWAWIVAVGLVVAMVPMFIGLVVALPVLGHTTWHLYRKLIETDPFA